MHVMFEITVTDGGAIFFFKPVSFSKIYIKSTVLLYVSVLSGGNGGKQTPFPMKFTSKSVVAVVRQSGGTCKARNYSLNSWDWLDLSFARNLLTALVHQYL